MSRVLQIIPQLPGTLDGVGDYALNLARPLQAEHGLTSVFVVAREASATEKAGFPVISGLGAAALSAARECERVILHYVNYGYQARGVPFHLRQFARELRGRRGGRWLTNFHEFYASGPPWKSEFWLHPLQVKIARDLVGLSDSCLVSNPTIEKAIHRIDPQKSVRLAPVLSNFGEPSSVDFGAASPKHWAIAGGTALVARSLLSFPGMLRQLPAEFFPEELEVIGGRDEPIVRRSLEKLRRAYPRLTAHYHPQVESAEASALLARCTFAWLNYYGHGKVWPGMILKSGIFAACGAHGVVPVLAHQENPFAVDGDPISGPWFITAKAMRLPPADRLGETREKIFAWYQAHAAARQLARVYAEGLA